MAETNDPSPGRDPFNDRRKLARALREARDSAGLTQSELGGKVGRHPSVISRLEKAEYDMPPELASNLAEVLAAPHLADLATAPSKGRQHPRTPSSRSEVLKGLLKARQLDRLVVVVADEVEIVKRLREARTNLPANITVVFPTRRRQQELDGALIRTLDDVNTPTRKPYSRWNVQNQINRLFEATSRDADDHIGAAITLYESDRVESSFFLVGSANGVFCASWPRPPITLRASNVLATVTPDSDSISDMEEHLDDLLRGCIPLTHLKAVAVLDDPKDGNDQHRHSLTGFFTLGTDSEAAILDERSKRNSTTAPSVGFAVSLVLVHGLVPQAERGLSLGERPLGRRLLLPWDDKTHTHELFATHVSNPAFEDETQEETEHSARPYADAIAAADRVADINRTNQDPPGFISPRVFRHAASRWILDEYGVTVPADAFIEIDLPPELRIVSKEGRLPILPRLFQLDLSPDSDPQAMGDPADRMRAGVDFRPALKRAFQRDQDVAAVSLADLRSEDTRFNNFIDMARAFDGGWLLRIAEQLKITEQ